MNQKEEEEEEERTTSVGKRILLGKKKSPQRPLRLEKRRGRRGKKGRKKTSTSNIIDQKQKHRNVANGGRHRRTVRVEPTSILPPLAWLKKSLQSQLQSQHHSQQQTCMESRWHWSHVPSEQSTTLLLENHRQVLFHPRTSSSTQVIRANQPLPSDGKHYWEIYVPAVYGTSMMFGIATNQQQLHSSSFTDLLGSDQHGWALSHQGLLWHNGLNRRYLPQPMETLKPVLIGLEFDADARTLAYRINNQSMGVAFHSIPRNVAIYPAVSSTSAQSTMVLQHCCRLCSSLREICLRFVKSSQLNENRVNQLLPRHLYEQLIS